MLTDLSESTRRLYEKLQQDLGNELLELFTDPDVNEIMLNPDGKIWADRVECGLIEFGTMSLARAYAIMHDIAGIHGFVINNYHPYLEAELPFFDKLRGERFTGQVPPIVSAPCFTIRKKAETIFPLESYVETGRMTDLQFTVLQELITTRKNILVCGGPGSGKTTLTNALINSMVRTNANQRLVILEDIPELQCDGMNKVKMLTSDTIDLTCLLRMAMRMRPDRIFIGEVRGREALAMLKAWNTGCPGGIGTLHANGTIEAIQRILDLAMEAGINSPPKSLVAHTIDGIVSIQRIGTQKGMVQEIVKIEDYQHDEFKFKKLA